MAKLLTIREAEEMINTMLGEHGSWRGIIKTYEDDNDDTIYSFHTVTLQKKGFWKWKKERLVVTRKCWKQAKTLNELVDQVEQWSASLGPAEAKADEMRRRHAARLLDKKIVEP